MVKRKKYSKKEQASRNRLRLKLIKEIIYNKNNKNYYGRSRMYIEIKKILRDPDIYLKNKIFNKMLVSDNKEIWDGHRWVSTG